MNIEVLVLGPVRTNCYIVSDENTKNALVIDPADQADKIAEVIRDKGLKLCAILLTHGHFDHITGVKELLASYPVKVYAAMKEENLLKEPSWNCSADLGRPVSIVADEWVENKDKLVFGNLSCEVIATPGHTKGSICYYFSKEKVLFSGDTLFFESLGRTDLPTGSAHQITESVNNQLMCLPDETKVYPGHGSETSIGYERGNNPFLTGNGWE